MYKTLVIIFLLHIFAGFFLQSNRISKLKREKKQYLFQHVGMYTLVFIVLSPILLGLTILQGLLYSLINGVFHYIVDYYTGKLKARFIGKNDGNVVPKNEANPVGKNEVNYNLIVVLDYTIHLIILMGTYFYMYPDAYKIITFWEKYN